MIAGVQIAHHTTVVNDVRLHYVEAGTGPVVLLLHGFPDFWYTWRLQIPALLAAGFRVIAPDLRGYNESDKPRGWQYYWLDMLVSDMSGLLQNLGIQHAAVVGHDWGGVIAWRLGAEHPELVDRLVILNSPHPEAYRRELRRGRQLLKSWYVLAFQLPWLPEALFRAFGFKLLRTVYAAERKRGASFTDQDIEHYVAAFSKPGTLEAAINYYRAAVTQLLQRRRSDEKSDVGVPTLVIWGTQDFALDERLLEGLDQWAPDLRIERIADAGHWVHLEKPDRVNQLLVEFLRSTPENPAD